MGLILHIFLIFFLLICLCVHIFTYDVWLYVCVNSGPHMCWCLCGGQRASLGVVFTFNLKTMPLSLFIIYYCIWQPNWTMNFQQFFCLYLHLYTESLSLDTCSCILLYMGSEHSHSGVHVFIHWPYALLIYCSHNLLRSVRREWGLIISILTNIFGESDMLQNRLLDAYCKLGRLVNLLKSGSNKWQFGLWFETSFVLWTFSF